MYKALSRKRMKLTKTQQRLEKGLQSLEAVRFCLVWEPPFRNSSNFIISPLSKMKLIWSHRLQTS